LRYTISQKQRDKFKIDLTRNNLKDVPQDQNTYCAIGRTFLKADRAELDNTLNTSFDSLDAEIPRLTKTLQEYETRREAAEKELREMVDAFKQQGGNVVGQ